MNNPNSSDPTNKKRGLSIAWHFTRLFLVLSLLATPVLVTSAAAQTNNPVYLPVIQSSTSPVMTGPGEWPMAGANPQRTSWTPTEVTGKLKPEWYTHFDSYISQKVQIIAAANKLFISAADGVHALDSNGGRELWLFSMSMPPGNSPTYVDNVLYVGGYDRKIYAINATNGQELWSYAAEAGFETNPLVVNGMLYAGNRDGYFYAVYASGAKTGQLAWRYKTDGPILYSAAYKDNTVFFASSDMYAYALNATTGALNWKSAKLPGTGFHSWWPVVYDNYVVFTGSFAYRNPAPFPNQTHVRQDVAAYPANAAIGDTIGPSGKVAWNWAPGTNTMDASRISKYLEDYPHRRTTFVLNLSNGTEFTYDANGNGKPEYAPYLYIGAKTGTRYPPVVGPDNVLYESNNYIFGGSDGIARGFITGWKIGTSTISLPTRETNAIDEPMGYAIGGNTVYWKRCCDRKAGHFNLASGSSNIYYDEGMFLRYFIPDLFNEGWDFSYWKHGDTTPPIPYNGRVYLIANNAVVAFSIHGSDQVMTGEDRGKVTGVRVSELERANTYIGLNTKITQNNNSWPLLIQQEQYYVYRPDVTERPNYFKLFEVAGTTSGNPTTLQLPTPTKLTTSLVSAYSGSNTLKSTISKRSPTILFENTSNTYQLRGTLAAFAYMGSGGAQVVTGSGSINGSAMSEGWILAWDGATSHRWAPVVISLQKRPTEVRLDGNGLTITYPGASGFLSVTPFYGLSAPKSAEENAWRSGIPQAAQNRARLLHQAALAFATDYSENKVINSGNGDLDWTYTYTYTLINDDWNTSRLQLAYLPPVHALAAWNGSPIRINNQPYSSLVDLGFVTPAGRVGGAANTNMITIHFPGLANTWKMPAPSVPSVQGDPLQAKLIAEIEKMIAAGHLMPGYGQHGLWDAIAGRLGSSLLSDYWHNPTETIYTLTRALPLLPPNLQTQVRTYLASENASFPILSTGHEGWATGASREWADLPPEVMQDRGSVPACGECSSWGKAQENVYGAWLYAQTFGGAAGLFSNASSWLNTSPQFKQSTLYALNSQLAGLIGYLRLADAAGAGAQTSAQNTTIDLLITRAALSKLPAALAETGFEYGGYQWAVRTYAPNMPDTLFQRRIMGTNWSQTPTYGYILEPLTGGYGPNTGSLYAFGIDYVNLTPEVAQFMHDYVLDNEQTAVADYARRTPYWFVSKAEEGAGETALVPIYDTIALFNAKAMILKESRAELEKYLDVPAVRVGDLYYIQRLILTLMAP